jgi:hypothetical protein
LVFGAPLSTASAAPAAGPETTRESPSAESIFRRGQAKYETADYNGAIELWTEAYSLVDPTPENAAIKALLIYNLAQAHIKAYEIDDDAVHLKQAKQLLDSFAANLPMLYDDEAQLGEEQAKVDERLAEIDAKIADHDRAEAEAETKLEPEPEPEPPAPIVEPASGETDRPVARGKPLIIAGGVLAGLGVLGGVAAIVGGVIGSGANDISDIDRDDLLAREDQFAVGQGGNSTLLVGSITAGVLVPTGVALIVVGVLRNKKAKHSGSAALPMLSPNFGPAGAGLSVSGRF